MDTSPLPIELQEFSTCELPLGRLTDEKADQILAHYRDYLELTEPVARLGRGWTLRSKGWVGILPLGGDDRIVLTPKVPVRNFFRMLATAYKFGVQTYAGAAQWSRCDELFEALLQILAAQVNRRAKRGFHREYVCRTDDLPFVRGRLMVQEMIRRPVVVRPVCRYAEHTGDIPDNQIPAWALAMGLRSVLCTSRSRVPVRAAFRALAGVVTLQPQSARSCVGRHYSRLNADYEAIHALSRFILESTGHTHAAGDAETVPFLIDTARLFEMFVAEWMAAHLPPDLVARGQEVFRFAQEYGKTGRIDLVIRDRVSNTVRMVLDTKYKVGDETSSDDIYQAAAYAAAMGCNEAVLVYPNRTRETGRTVFQWSTRVRTAAFPLDGNLDEAGFRLLEELGIAAAAVQAS